MQIAVHCIIGARRVLFDLVYPGKKTLSISKNFQTNMAESMTELQEFADIDHDTEFLPADVADILEHVEEGIEVIVEEDDLNDIFGEEFVLQYIPSIPRDVVKPSSSEEEPEGASSSAAAIPSPKAPTALSEKVTFYEVL